LIYRVPAWLFLITSLLLLRLPVYGQGQQVELSEHSVISVITIGPDEYELYAGFGHNAIRVYDPENGIDKAYNFGTFDFDQPNFYLNFARGNLLYKLSVVNYLHLRNYWRSNNRFLHEQILDLNLDQRQRTFEYLENNALPENASYYYDYFYDNCATRIRDVFVSIFGDSLRFDGSYISGEMTVRDLTDQYLHGRFSWGDLGIDVCLGLPMDKVMTPFEYMYIPDYIEYGFENAFLTGSDGTERRLVLHNINVFQSLPFAAPTKITPLLVFSLFLAAIALTTWFNIRKGTRSNTFDFIFFLILGLLGIFLMLLWFGTDHKAAANNFNLLWAFPIHLIAAFSVRKDRIGFGWRRYFKITAIILGAVLLGWNLLPQDLNFSLIPIVLIIVIRSAFIGWGVSYQGNHSI